MSRRTGRGFSSVEPTLARGSAGLGALVLMLGALALAIPSDPLGARTTWESLLAPYSTGASLPDGFRIQEIRRGPDNGIVVSVRRPADGAAVEVVVVERGRWTSVQESESFTIDYEVPHSPAAERAAVTALLADTIRARDHGLPAPDAIPLRADDPSFLPWWLEMLRGVRGMLLGASVVVLALLGVVGGAGVARVAVVLGGIDLAARLMGVPASRPDLGAFWLVPAAAALFFAAFSGRRVRCGIATWLAVALGAGALLLRLALGAWGPLHVNGHGARFVAGAARDAADIAAYGPGYREIFGPIAALAPANPDWAIFAANAVCSALVVPLAFTIGRGTGLSTTAAFVAALLLALDPVALRTGATEAYFGPIGVLGAAATAALLAALRALDAGRRRRAAASLVGAGLLLAQAARVHPCAWVLMATVPFVLLAGDAGSRRRRLLVAIAAAAISGGVLLCTSANVLLDVLGNIRTGTVFRPSPPSPWPLLWMAVPAVVYVAFAPRPWLALPAAVAVAAMMLTRHAFDASWIWEQAYFRLYLTLPVIAALAWVPQAWLRRLWIVVPAAAMLALAWVRIGWPIVTARSTEHREYRWVREQIAQLPPDCRVVYVSAVGPRFLLLPTYVGPTREAVAVDPRRRPTVEAALAPASCLVYVHGSLCSTRDGHPECDAFERRLGLVPIARASFPATRVRETFAYESETVECWIARVERVDGEDER